MGWGRGCATGKDTKSLIRGEVDFESNSHDRFQGQAGNIKELICTCSLHTLPIPDPAIITPLAFFSSILLVTHPAPYRLPIAARAMSMESQRSPTNPPASTPSTRKAGLSCAECRRCVSLHFWRPINFLPQSRSKLKCDRYATPASPSPPLRC